MRRKKNEELKKREGRDSRVRRRKEMKERERHFREGRRKGGGITHKVVEELKGGISKESGGKEKGGEEEGRGKQERVKKEERK